MTNPFTVRKPIVRNIPASAKYPTVNIVVFKANENQTFKDDKSKSKTNSTVTNRLSNEY